MGSFKHFIAAFFGGLALILLVHAHDHSDFISIDCGLTANSSYSEPTTGINYISDAAFIDTGVSKQISSEFEGDFQLQVLSLRSFPEGIRNCYSINVRQGQKYLIRATFLYGNYDGQSKLPQFDLHLGPNMWDTIKIKSISLDVFKELIHVPSLNYLQICLANTGLGTPFISAIELRPLTDMTYETVSNTSLALYVRLDLGSVSKTSYRYPEDVYDRIWKPDNSRPYLISWESFNEILDDNTYWPPDAVMRTAATSSDSLDFQWVPDDPISEYRIYMHFAEVVKLKPNQSRSFNITIDGEELYTSFVPRYLITETMYSQSVLPRGKYDFSLVKTESSTLPPIINAVEVYSVKNLSQSETDKDDVAAITKIKSTYGIKRNWQGDPCAPQAYSWEGLNCSYDGYDGYNTPRIISLNLSSSVLTGEIFADISNLVMLQYLNLSSSGLTGEISAYISNLVMLQYLDLSNNSLTGEISAYIANLGMLEYLDLSNNSLTGSVPDFLSQLKYLRVLNLELNLLTGSIPAALIQRAKKGALSVNVEENSIHCGLDSCEKKKKKNIVVPIVASIGGIFILSLTVMAILWGLRSRKKQDTTKVAKVDIELKVENQSIESTERKFTYPDLQKITNNFERILGKGGFGKVYHGCIDGYQVAVKMLSQTSGQGYQQFQAEVKLLRRVHHRNLTTLVGYCYDGTNMGLIYEYMANGDLKAHLSGENTNILTWETRLQIALDAAQGLEYLHHGCKPPIIHRDVKTVNILLNEKLRAKLADFGLSKIFPTDTDTHMSTIVAGTYGYLDPEYFTTHRLTKKTDVYSFGVVLLEIITNQPVIQNSNEMTHIRDWVSFMLAERDIKNIVDPRLRGNYNINSVRKAIDIAMYCVSLTPGKRPTMDQVVVELKECLAAELAQMKEGCQGETEDSNEQITILQPR